MRDRGDQQVLGLAHQRAHAAQRRTHRAMHQQASQEGPEVFQVFAVQVVYAVIHRVVVFLMCQVLARGDLMIDRVETHADADQHRGDGEGVEKGRKKRCDQGKQQGQQDFRADIQ